MSTPALFDSPEPARREPQWCERCLDGTNANVDELRVQGWTVFDGTSLTGQSLKVRICPTCGDRKDRTARPTVSFLAYRRCPICQAVSGMPCTSQSGKIIDGQPDGVRTELEYPHKARRLRNAWKPTT